MIHADKLALHTIHRDAGTLSDILPPTQLQFLSTEDGTLLTKIRTEMIRSIVVFGWARRSGNVEADSLFADLKLAAADQRDLFDLGPDSVE